MRGERILALWPRSAPALPFGQPAYGGHGLRFTVPQRPPAETLTGPDNFVTLSTQGGRHPP
jgi:hypothetical protein